jgi:hypothetical protein
MTMRVELVRGKTWNILGVMSGSINKQSTLTPTGLYSYLKPILKYV